MRYNRVYVFTQNFNLFKTRLYTENTIVRYPRFSNLLRISFENYPLLEHTNAKGCFNENVTVYFQLLIGIVHSGSRLAYFVQMTGAQENDLKVELSFSKGPSHWSTRRAVSSSIFKA